MYDMLVHENYQYHQYMVYIWVRISTVIKIIKWHNKRDGKDPWGFSDMSVNIFYYDHQEYIWLWVGS